MNHDLPGGTYRMGDLELTRVGYGAMQLAGPHVFGPPKDRDAAIAVLRAVVDTGINHIDTSQFYGPDVTNEIIREALHPYGDDLHLVTKIGAKRDERGAWPRAESPAELRDQVHQNLRTLGLERLDVVNFRADGGANTATPQPYSIAEQISTLADLQREGLIRHVGVSTVSAEQLAEARAITPIVCVQNLYNVVLRGDDDLVDATAADGIAYVPYFPLGGFSPIQAEELDSVAADLGATPKAVALAWLLQRSPNLMLIPGTSSVDHLRENVAAAGLELPADAVATLDTLAAHA